MENIRELFQIMTRRIVANYKLMNEQRTTVKPFKTSVCS